MGECLWAGRSEAESRPGVPLIARERSTEPHRSGNFRARCYAAYGPQDTRIMFERYSITTEGDLHEAVERLNAPPKQGVIPLKAKAAEG